jgi:hypothetical protein
MRNPVFTDDPRASRPDYGAVPIRPDRVDRSYCASTGSIAALGDGEEEYVVRTHAQRPYAHRVTRMRRPFRVTLFLRQQRGKLR